MEKIQCLLSRPYAQSSVLKYIGMERTCLIRDSLNRFQARLFVYRLLATLADLFKETLKIDSELRSSAISRLGNVDMGATKSIPASVNASLRRKLPVA